VPLFQRYLLRELFQSAVITFGVITIISVAVGSLTVLHDLDVITFSIFSRTVGALILSQLNMTLPLTFLVAVVMTYGRAAADNELNSMRAAGIHLYTALAPALLFGILGTAVVLFVNDRVAPRLRALSASALLEGQLVPIIQATLDRGDHVIELGRRTWVFIRDQDSDGTLHDVRFKKLDRSIEPGEAGPLEHEFMAREARFTVDTVNDQIILEGWDVKSLVGKSKDTTFSYMSWPIRLSDESREVELPQYTLSDLVAAGPRRYKGAPKGQRIEVEYHQRIAGAFGCLLFVLLAAPLAIIFKHGNRMVAFLIAFLIALLGYYPLFLLGDLLAEEAGVSPVIAAWSGSGVILLLGLGLTAVVFRR